MELSDQVLVRAALEDREAFSGIIERYQGALARYIQRLGSLDADTAKDILQESFIKVYLNLNDYDPRLPFSSWIYRITHNEVMGYFRHTKNRAHALPQGDVSELFSTLPNGLDISEEVDARLRSLKVAAALARVKPGYRQALVLRFFEEKSYDEISDILQIPAGTVATHIARGKAALEQTLRQSDITDL